ncbi:MAG: DNA alkylation repair protein [Sphingobacteriales bacterium]|nr:DNA alkylation repair protein [Sphingobacteriales bacterium]
MNRYSDSLKNFLEGLADKEKAIQMEKYMKNKVQFFGVPSDLREEFYKDYMIIHGVPDDKELLLIIRDLWEQPQREYQYFAMEMLRKLNRFANTERLELYEFMIVNRSWWDTVDFIASNLVGPFFLKYQEMKEEYCKKWMQSGNIWLQRTVLLFQLKYNEKTDTALLSRAILELSSSKEFFIRKAIGWSLRQYSKTNPDFVSDFVEKNKEKLSPLSRKEALKVINKKRMD